jgi:tRNA (cmo5U34)-methyltransferase
MQDPLPKDQLFTTPTHPGEFRFDEAVAAVFADMIQRSVPGYGLTIGMIGLLAEEYAQAHSHCYDLGCSLGAATLAMQQRIQQPHCCIIAVDNSEAMIERCRQNVCLSSASVPVEILCADLKTVPIQRASVVVLNFTLQFVPTDDRPLVLQRIYDGLLPGGVLILSEKIAFAEGDQGDRFRLLHERFKRVNGYSELEISQKRTALETVLIPETLDQHQQRLRTAGFSPVDTWFQCFNFVSLLAWKV